MITGASSGIGEAFADVFAAEGFDLIVTARRADRLAALAGRLAEQHGIDVAVIPCDLGEHGAAGRLCDEIAARGLAVDGLVNNAGYGVPGVFLSPSWDRHEAMLQVMVVGLTELTYRLLPAMVDRGDGLVINVASLAGLVPAPAGHTLYAATKSFLIKFSEALAHEVGPRGVRVTALCPGFTLSEFHDVTGTRASVSQLPAWLWMDAPTVARQGYDAVMAGTPIYINGRVNRTIALLSRYVPQRVVVGVGRWVARKNRKT